LSFSDLVDMAKRADSFGGFINPNDSRFLGPCDMPAKINEYLTETGRKPINDKGQIIRIVLESLAFNYRWVIEKLEEIIGEKIEVLHIVGGGIQNELLCQFVANATGKKVLAGPVEATAMGNVLMQATATGQIESLADGRKLIRNSVGLKEYIPEDSKRWNSEYNKVKQIFET
jgi:rhamnulokinase